MKGEYPRFIKGHNHRQPQRNKGDLCDYGHEKTHLDTRDGHYTCRICHRAKRWVRMYGITFEQALAKPEHCDLCRVHESNVLHGTMSVDHNHATGKFRGWLCHRCNRGLQLFHDDAELMQKAADYLKEHE